MIPLVSGRVTTICGGVFPNMCLASFPTANICSVFVFTATTEGSLITIPFSFVYTSVLAVPRSMPISLLNFLKKEENIIIFFCERQLSELLDQVWHHLLIL